MGHCHIGCPVLLRVTPIGLSVIENYSTDGGIPYMGVFRENVSSTVSIILC